MKEQIKKIIDDSVYKSRETIMQEITALCEARCQARVERLIEDLDPFVFGSYGRIALDEIKKREGVE